MRSVVPQIVPVLVIGLVVFTGCLNPFAPDLSESIESSDLIITKQETPDEVLQNFKVAYTFRDSLLYSDLLDTAFIFVFFDPNEGTSGRFVSWGREVDLKTTGNLFRHFEMIDLVWNTTLYAWASDRTGEISKSFTLMLIGRDSDISLTGTALFSFRRCSDMKWRITRWKDESDI